ncbi:uncharacterized protein LOC121372581 [Gigantopelta aegis]|uniref:uncharacterized protein LOC121372581 n=1 Tax=Gigantopelta aegis TaxID=1735272 RepID=UPI001B88BA7A|nr:uncharacterized protein LOC121372581 [Gigantopelta aegis]
MPPRPNTSRVSNRGKGREKSRVRSRSHSPAASVAESEASHATSEAPVTETGRAEVQDSDDTDRSSVASQKTKKAKVVTDLTTEEEESMVEWLEAYPILYNKKLQAYKDTAKKERLWMEKATEMGKSVLVLKTWYTSLRSRFGRLKKKSGDEATEAEMTERDLWIVRRFEFLCPHIHEVQRKTTVSMKQKLAAASATSTASGMVEDEDDNDTSRPPPALTPSSVVSSTPRSRQKQISTEAEAALLARLEEHSQQMIALQQQIMDRLKPSADREREAFVDWMRSVILDLDHSIWRRCQLDISQILYRYIGENDQLKILAALSHSAAPTPSTTQFLNLVYKVEPDAQQQQQNQQEQQQ